MKFNSTFLSQQALNFYLLNFTAYSFLSVAEIRFIAPSFPKAVSHVRYRLQIGVRVGVCRSLLTFFQSESLQDSNPELLSHQFPHPNHNAQWGGVLGYQSYQHKISLSFAFHRPISTLKFSEHGSLSERLAITGC